MNEYYDDQLRNEIIGLGKKSIRKNHYRSLLEKKKALEEKNEELENEIKKRYEAEENLKELNEELEKRIYERTVALEETNDKLTETLKNLEKTYELLLETEKLSSLNHLVIGIAHELNTPIGTGLTTGTYLKDLLLDFSKKINDDNLSKKEMLYKINQLLSGMDLLIKSSENSAEIVSNFKKISDMRLDKKIKQFDVEEAISFAIRSMKSDFQRHRNVEVEVDRSENLIIETDLSIFTQLLNIFISNSLRYAFDENGGTIKIGVEEEKGYYVLKYSDNGIGISKDISSHIFEPFFTTSRSANSSGLGLFTAYNLVKSLSGEITFKTNEQKGLSFTVRIPK